MNKCAIITGFLGETRNRYMVYQGNRSLAEKFEMLARIAGVDGVELGYPADFEDRGALRELLKKSGTHRRLHRTHQDIVWRRRFRRNGEV